ncbi:sialidase family protein [Candidatus Latescibacterota bacterium]
MMTLIILITALISGAVSCAADSGTPPVQTVGVDFRANLVVLPDGAWEVYKAYKETDDFYILMRSRSTDSGHTWSTDEALKTMEGDGWAGAVSLLDRDGEVHLFFMRWRNKEGRKPAVDRFIDIWHIRSSGHRNRWSNLQRIFAGYVGSIQNAIQLRGGRIILPFAYWVGDSPSAPPTGSNITTTVFSDDGGETWQQSSAELTAPCYPDYNGNNYGAVEPVIIELADGQVWMLVRTQTGFLYESFSPDGDTWSTPAPSRFRSSTSPAYLLRLPDKRIALFWNNCEMPPRHNGAGVYGGRDQMHAAISDDEGATWYGFREVYLDPTRNETPPKRGDRGTAYPHAVATLDGHIALVTGQGQGRRGLVIVDPAWLSASYHEDDFSSGLDGWNVFKAFGPAKGWWRDRLQGPQLIDHPDKPGRRVLHVRRPDKYAGDGAVWNFPAGQTGRLTVTLMLRQGFHGGSIALTDRFFNPTDDNGESEALFVLPLGDDYSLPGGYELDPGTWYTLTLEWNVDARHCNVLVDGEEVSWLKMLNETVNGASYVRFRSGADEVDIAGMLIESVKADVKR